jgi:CO/xanthine dehydrogenase Mo-binding subunit
VGQTSCSISHLSRNGSRVIRFSIVHDCGQIINPDGARNQIEGSVVQTMSRTLLEEVKFNRSTITSRDWATYPILTFPNIPEIEAAGIGPPIYAVPSPDGRHVAFPEWTVSSNAWLFRGF